MSDNDKQDLLQAVPFFARYLEGQINFIEEISESESQDVGGGTTAMTLKYPSDNEEGSGDGKIAMTKKYPSDNEDSLGGGGVPVTRKYPSDCEDSLGGSKVVTQKYPSDGDDDFSAK